jgi:hypothetical protein
MTILSLRKCKVHCETFCNAASLEYVSGEK